MSFPPPRTSSPQAQTPEDWNGAVSHHETQTLVQHDAELADTKPETDTQPALITPPQVPPGLSAPEYTTQNAEGPIRLAPDEEDQVSRTGPWHRPTLPDCFRDMRPENRGILDDMGRGMLIIVTTPIAFTGMALYACGMIIEGVALLLKGVGSLGGRLLMRRRRRFQSPDPQWV